MRIQDALIHWYDREGRALPWRERFEPYPILVSEMMLQQTQVSRVIEYFERWMKRFPNWKALAEAPVPDVLMFWAGLGYNRRALALRHIAKCVVENGEPSTYEEWLNMKGVGPYTASAVAVFALGEKRLPIDTNVRRVLGRVYLGVPFPDNGHDKKIDESARDILDHARFSDVPQAIFDLANTYCLKTPSCEDCPLRNYCASADGFTRGDFIAPKRTVAKPKETIREGKRYPDRIFRGRILLYIRNTQGVENTNAGLRALGNAIDPSFLLRKDKQWLKDMLDRMTKDGLLTMTNDIYHIPSY